jgi:hypothetical protein
MAKPFAIKRYANAATNEDIKKLAKCIGLT